MKRLLLSALLLLSVSAYGQALTVTKSVDGADVILTWTGGTGPFTVIRCRQPQMATRCEVLSADAESPYTCTGNGSDGVRLEFYQVQGTGKPVVAITTPTANFTNATPCIAVSGTHTGAAHVYVNGQEATINGATWSIASAPLAISADPTTNGGTLVVVTVAAVDSSGLWTTATVSGSYTGTAATSTHPCVARAVGQ